jgi:hypothetical protein
MHIICFINIGLRTSAALVRTGPIRHRLFLPFVADVHQPAEGPGEHRYICLAYVGLLLPLSKKIQPPLQLSELLEQQDFKSFI